MTDIKINTPSSRSTIHCGKGAFDRYAGALSGGQNFIITDSNVYALYDELIYNTFGEQTPIYVLPAGEGSKTAGRLLDILSAMAKVKLHRSGRVIAFGGGVVGDIAGLAASLYMRGVKLTQIPTTLLSQVDSSVGGKTAVDFAGVKNLIGSFYQPNEVIIDPMFLKTLPAREIRCGLGEIIKYGALDADIYARLIKNQSRLSDLDFLASITPACVKCKAKTVRADEKDISGERKKLNLGHTTGHAFELFYKRKSHGEFVLIGAYYELYIAEQFGIVSTVYADSLKKLITSVITVPAYDNIEKAAEFAFMDKKNTSDKISLIVPESEGVATELELDYGVYANLLSECAHKIEGDGNA